MYLATLVHFVNLVKQVYLLHFVNLVKQVNQVIFCESGVSGESSCLVSPDALGVTVF